MGVSALSLPFILLLLSVIAPNFLLEMKKIIFESTTSDDSSLEQERIIYHEAGHFLVGYLCGVLIAAYDVSGENDAGTTIELPHGENISAKSAHLMVTAIAGVVAETLRFGNAKGGVEDLPVIFEIMRIDRIKVSDRQGILRWTAMKALNLLKMHRDELDEVAMLMKKQADVHELILSVETMCDSWHVEKNAAY